MRSVKGRERECECEECEGKGRERECEGEECER